MNKKQLILCLVIGNVSGAVIWNPPVRAWDLATGLSDMVNSVHDALAPARTEAQTPLPVPTQPPIGNSTSIQPCAAPPPTMAAAPVEEMLPEAMQSLRKETAAVNAPVKPLKPVATVSEPEDRTLWLASKLKYPQTLRSVKERFGNPSNSEWNNPRSYSHYTTETGRTLTFEIYSPLGGPDFVLGYKLQ